METPVGFIDPLLVMETEIAFGMYRECGSSNYQTVVRVHYLWKIFEKLASTSIMFGKRHENVKKAIVGPEL